MLYTSVYCQEMGIIMQVNSFYIPCCSNSRKSKHLKTSPFFQHILLFLDETTIGVKLQDSRSIVFWVIHMVLEKKKLNLLTDSVVCSCPHSCSTSHYFIEILDREDKNRTKLFV